MSEDHKYVLKLMIEQDRKAETPALPADEFFERFTAEQILKSRGLNIDVDQLNACNVDGGNDGGVDGLFCFVNHVLIAEDTQPEFLKGVRPAIELILIQSTQHPGFTEAHIQKFSDFTNRCLRLPADHSKYEDVYTPKLLALADKFRKVYESNLTNHPTVNLRFYVASMGEQVDPKIQLRADEFQEKCREFFHGASIDVVFFGADKLLTWRQREIEKTLKLPLAATILWKQNGIGYVGLVRLHDFYRFISDEGLLREHLFESNVRDFQGHSIEVNQAIRKSLDSKEVDEFWWLNNGVTILASDVSGDNQLLALTDPLIVNGLQTSSCTTIFRREAERPRTSGRFWFELSEPTMRRSLMGLSARTTTRPRFLRRT